MKSKCPGCGELVEFKNSDDWIYCVNTHKVHVLEEEYSNFLRKYLSILKQTSLYKETYKNVKDLFNEMLEEDG